MSIDPLADKYAYQSPYNFSENFVINSRELEGLEASLSIDGDVVHITNKVKITNNTYGMKTDEQVQAMANLRAAQESVVFGGCDAQGRTVNYSVVFDKKATIEWSYNLENDVSGRKYENSNDGLVSNIGDAFAYGLTDEIGNTQRNRTQINVSSIAQSFGVQKNKYTKKPEDSPTAEKDRIKKATQTGVHETGHMFGGRHEYEDDKSNPNKNQGKNANHLMNGMSDGYDFTPKDRSRMIDLIQQQRRDN